MSRLGLADAIRLGSRLRPQTFGRLRDVEGSCALGAALEAVSGTVVLGDGETMCAELPELSADAGECPVCLYKADPRSVSQTLPLSEIIMHLNDRHHWTRERIADLVEDFLFNRACNETGRSTEPLERDGGRPTSDLVEHGNPRQAGPSDCGTRPSAGREAVGRRDQQDSSLEFLPRALADWVESHAGLAAER